MSEPKSIVCNAGPLIALGKLNRLDLLASLHVEVQMPEAVYQEVVQQGTIRGEPDARVVRLFWQQQGWPVVPISPVLLASIQPSAILGQGELAVLALASSLTNPVVLMDDASARREARHMGLKVRGTLGILVQGYRRQYLTMAEVEFLIREIVERPDIWINSRLCQEVLAHLRN